MCQLSAAIWLLLSQDSFLLIVVKEFISPMEHIIALIYEGHLKLSCHLALEESLSTVLSIALVNELFSRLFGKLLVTYEFSGLMWLHLL